MELVVFDALRASRQPCRRCFPLSGRGGGSTFGAMQWAVRGRAAGASCRDGKSKSGGGPQGGVRDRSYQTEALRL